MKGVLRAAAMKATVAVALMMLLSVSSGPPLAGAVAIDASAANRNSLRSSAQEQRPRQQREHVIRRLYGEHSRNVRNELSKIEERIPRYSTGIPANPNHKVPYLNHPYDPETKKRRLLQRKRELQTDDDGGATDDDVGVEDNVDAGPSWEPMRIKFFTEALDAADDGADGLKIAWYKREVLPRTRDFWSRALSVIPVEGNLVIDDMELDSRTYCGDPEFTAVPTSHLTQGVSDADVLLYVSGSYDELFCPERTLAVAVPCNFDQFDRPTAGAINVCLANIVIDDEGKSTEDMIEDYVDVTQHEVAHVFGHSSNSYRFFWYVPYTDDLSQRFTNVALRAIYIRSRSISNSHPHS